MSDENKKGLRGKRGESFHDINLPDQPDDPFRIPVLIEMLLEGGNGMFSFGIKFVCRRQSTDCSAFRAVHRFFRREFLPVL